MNKQLYGLFVLMVLASCGSKKQEVKPEMKQLTMAVYASGSLVPEEEYKVVSGVDGYLTQALVKEGDVVNKGQLLFIVNSDVRAAQVQGANAVVKETMPAVVNTAPAFRELRAQMDVAKTKLQQDSVQYKRYKALFDQNAIASATYEKFYLQFQSSLKDYQNIKQRLEQQEITAKLQMQQAQNQLSIAEAQTAYGRLKSFANGTVYEIYKKEGDLVQPNQPIALVGAGKMIAKLSVDEDDLEKVSLNQKVLITMDAYPDKVFKAHISKIYPLLNRVEQSFKVDATLDDAVPVGMYGLNIEANIVVAENKPVLAIPKNALLKGDSLLLKDGKKIKVAKGIEDDNWVEIKEGITEQTTVVIAP
jgi:multidrug efflux pump subunit AcrA (membrane-fusion protein)